MEYQLPDIAIEAELIVKGIYAIARKAKAMNPTEIIEHLHGSEINGAIDWFYDGVWRWRIGDEWNGWKREGKADTFEAAVRELAESAFAEFPRSTFAGWWAIARG